MCVKCGSRVQLQSFVTKLLAVRENLIQTLLHKPTNTSFLLNRMRVKIIATFGLLFKTTVRSKWLYAGGGNVDGNTLCMTMIMIGIIYLYYLLDLHSLL